jgi:hypothetical protein
MRVLAQGHDELGAMDSEPYIGRKHGNVITSQSMMNQTTQILRDEFDKAYAERKGSSPYQQRK